MKMTWRQTLALCMLPLVVVLMLLLKNSPKESTPRAQARKIASFPIANKKPVFSPQVLKAIRGHNVVHKALRNRIPQSLEESFQKNTSVKITKGFELLTDVAAVQKKDYRKEMGEKISESDHFVYFKASPGHNHTLVAIARMSNLLYPVANVVHLRNATASIREELLAQGYRQYYYNPRLKFLTLKGEEGKVLSLYQELIGKGYKAQLEVLKPGPVKH